MIFRFTCSSWIASNAARNGSDLGLASANPGQPWNTDLTTRPHVLHVSTGITVQGAEDFLVTATARALQISFRNLPHPCYLLFGFA